MAIIKPKIVSSINDKPGWLGVLPISINGFTDKSGEWDWAPIFISVEVMVEGSEYPRYVELAGDLEKDPNGNIIGGRVLTKLYKFFEIIGFDGGLTAQGTWEDGQGNPINDICEHLTQRFITGSPIENDYKYLTYVYQQQPKQVGGKIFTKCLPKIVQNNKEGKKDLEQHVSWMKSKGFLKEFIDKPAQPSDVTASAVDNL